ncbi:MAG: hypothetical protein LBC18_09085, partial [Opitutaceae bacterium]|nr:hypothetical protein [Opitutaceae bacterium]
TQHAGHVRSPDTPQILSRVTDGTQSADFGRAVAAWPPGAPSDERGDLGETALPKACQKTGFRVPSAA